jgi:CBS domain-containing protein
MPPAPANALVGGDSDERIGVKNAADVMTTDVVTVRDDTPVPQVVRLMLARGISGVPVVNGAGLVIGMLSEGDLLRRAELGTEKTRGALKEFFTGTAALAVDYVRTHGTLARDIMTHQVVCVQRDAPLADIADVMEERRIKRVPVLDGDRLVGIVSRSNLLRAFASMVPDAPPAQSDDASIRAALLAELAHQPWSRRGENSVVITDGVVHLWGLVSQPSELRALQLAAERIPGVKAVQNHMIVLSEEPYPLFPGSFVS